MRTENDYTETDLGNISPNPRGEYDEKASYEYLDLISYQGGSYLCLAEPKTIVSGIAPKAGQNTEVWQMIALPGDLTSEYIAMHDDIVVKAKQAEASRLAAELAQQTTEAARADVQQLHADAVRATEEAENSRDTAGGYAAAAEQSRKAAKESEDNAHAQVTGFDSYVAEKTTQATQDIESARQTAVSAVTSQQDTSVQAVAAEGKKYIDAIKADAETVANDRQAVEEAAQTVVTQAQEVAQNTQTVATNTESAAKSAQSAQTSAENAAKSAEGVQDAVNQITTNTKDISDLKTDVQNAEDVLAGKISKFYATNNGENHLADSDNGKIQDMVLYGKSEQNQYKGINLLPTGIGYSDMIEVSIPKGSIVFWVTDGTPADGGNFKFFNEDQTESMWFGVEHGTISMRQTLTIDAKYVQNLVNKGWDLSKICLGIGNDPVYEPYTGGQPSPSPDYPQEIKSVVKPTVKVSNEDGTKSQTVTLPYTLNAIPVSSGGNVTINGQQYIADYADVERGKLVKMVDSSKLDNTQSIVNKTEWLLAEPQEIDLTQEEAQTVKALATYYPTTNISINSEQLDGYTVFNYPISMANGWNYVKQQLNDNRDYIYDMDTQSAEAYVNSEYAVALTELEV